MRYRNYSQPVQTMEGTAAVESGAHVRAVDPDAEESMVIGGRALPFGQLAGPFGWIGLLEWYEVVMPEVNIRHFRGDVQAYQQHKPELILASESTGDATFTQDSLGLNYRYELDPDISYARDLYINVKKRKIKDSSVGFHLEEDDYTTETAEESGIQELIDRQNETGAYVLLDRIYAMELHENSVVSRGAYADTSAGLREFEDHHLDRLRSWGLDVNNRDSWTPESMREKIEIALGKREPVEPETELEETPEATASPELEDSDVSIMEFSIEDITRQINLENEIHLARGYGKEIE